jgi:predicted Zn-dependent protease
VLDGLAEVFRDVAPRAEFWSLRVVDERDERLSVLRGVVQPVAIRRDLGAMVQVMDGGGAGWCGTSDLSREGLRAAGEQALAWARRVAGRCVAVPAPAPARGRFETRCAIPWDSVPDAEKLGRLCAAAERLRADARIADWEAALWRTRLETRLASSAGASIAQRFDFLLPTLSATAVAAGESQTRTLGGHAHARQGGLELLDEVGLDDAARRIADEALELLAAPDCPSGRMDVVLAPDQMILQIHESIGHPLELDRILGDERNYAGSSFVTPDMFGTYRYGSELLTVVFDPGLPGELASYAFDDDGGPARRELLIERGLLLRGLGGAASQARSGLPGVACSRASGWSRPPIDRIGNLNLEPGRSSLAELVAGVERGVYLETNCSWSIDHERNKFQFGCERGRLIESGELGAVVRKPNYRGTSATFWRSLAAVGDASTREVLGTPFCGKGEPNQLARVGHAAPACRFTGVDVFGGA